MEHIRESSTDAHTVNRFSVNVQRQFNRESSFQQIALEQLEAHLHKKQKQNKKKDLVFFREKSCSSLTITTSHRETALKSLILPFMWQKQKASF